MDRAKEKWQNIKRGPVIELGKGIMASPSKAVFGRDGFGEGMLQCIQGTFRCP
jgi:hypothetical protein